MLSYAVAAYLDANVASLTFAPAGGAGNVFVEWMPPSPNVAVMVAGQPGLPQLSRLATDLPGLQVIVRADPYSVEAGHALARAVYSALTCLDGVTLDEGGPHEVYVIGCTATQSEPAPIGRDELQRPEWSLNFQLRTHAPTAHRP